MEIFVRTGILLSAVLAALWMRVFVSSLESAWHRAHQLRLSLLASPSATYASQCHKSTDAKEGHRLCRAVVLSKTQARHWASLCAAPFTQASRWYEIRLECKAPYGQSLIAKTRIWR